ncbi:MAG TPA: PASTA domain-containing protein, partial [Actinomycetota bacterium]|nr:PASTA domain-containing protein [Actinomycetota bacterium]
RPTLKQQLYRLLAPVTAVLLGALARVRLPRGPVRVGVWPVAMGSLVMLLLAAAVVAAPSVRLVDVPDVTGASVERAEEALVGAGFAVERRLEWSDEVAEGLVIRTDPSSGAQARPGAPIVVVASRGPAPVAIPAIVGLEVEAAKRALREAGLEVGSTSEIFDEAAPEGAVVSHSPTEPARPGTRVDLVVSKGPELVNVPAVTGKTLAEARRALTEAGFEPGRVSEEFHASVPAGAVVSQEPAAGRARRGTAVDLVVSKGPDAVTIPNLVGSGRSAARKALSDAGLKWAERVEASDTVAEGVVLRTDPAPGKQVPRGSAVTIVVSRGPATFAMPSLTGMSRTEAKAKAQSMGLVVSNEYAVPGSGRPAGEVQGQSPAPGTQVSKGSRVQIYYAAG